MRNPHSTPGHVPPPPNLRGGTSLEVVDRSINQPQRDPSDIEERLKDAPRVSLSFTLCLYPRLTFSPAGKRTNWKKTFSWHSALRHRTMKVCLFTNVDVDDDDWLPFFLIPMNSGTIASSGCHFWYTFLCFCWYLTSGCSWEKNDPIQIQS